jgi:hypothetical protein
MHLVLMRCLPVDWSCLWGLAMKLREASFRMTPCYKNQCLMLRQHVDTP